jgi:hypothetical protein
VRGCRGILGLLGCYVRLLSFDPSFLPLFAIWEAGMAFTLTIVAELPVDASGSVRVPSPPPANQTARLPSSSYVVISVLVALTVLGFSWLVVSRIQDNRYLGRWEAQNAEFVAAAPTRENLPPLVQPPLEQVFVARINELRLAGNGSVQPEIASPTPTPGHAGLLNT